MQSQRNTVFIILLILSAYMYFTWESDKTAKIRAQNQPEISISSPEKTNSLKSGIVKVSTDLYDMEISLNNGDILRADLKDQKEKIDSDENFHLLKINDNYKYFATSNLVATEESTDPTVSSKMLPVNYTVAQDTFTMSSVVPNGTTVKDYCDQYRKNRDPSQKKSEKDQNTAVSEKTSDDVLVVPLTGTTADGLTVVKTFTFERCSHSVNVSFSVSGVTKPLKLAQLSTLEQSVNDPELSSGMFGTSAYRGMAYSTSDTKYQKETFQNIAEEQLENISSKKGGWVSMIQHYFVSAWVGASNTANTIFYQGKDNEQTAVVGIRSSNISVNPGDKVTLSNILWVGPKDIHEMEKVSPHLELTVDYGWLSFLSIWLYYALEFIHQIVQNWGVAIIILTLIVRGCMYPLTKKQYVSMAKMRILAPKMNELKEKYKDNRQALSMAMMELYQKEKVNPLGGCFPILIQMPIFIALYWTFMESTELRHSSFMLWIKDLSAYDPYFVLPILMGLTMLLIQKMSPTPVTDPLQKKIMLLMPVVFTFLFCTFPAGLTLYWLVSNTVTIIQQSMIFRALEKKGLSLKKTTK